MVKITRRSIESLFKKDNITKHIAKKDSLLPKEANYLF